MGFGVVDVEPVGGGGVEGLGEVPIDGAAGVVLEEFAVGPVETAAGEEVEGDLERAAEAFEEEDGVWEFVADASGEVFPDGERDHVAGVAAEAIDTLAAPE